ncbi:MAG TPA: hypothetical protein VFR02_10100, partial [bacterium]|nr:hypothetical protein [bacterium]
MSLYENDKKARLIFDRYIYESTALYVGKHNLIWKDGAYTPMAADFLGQSQVVVNKIIGKCSAVVNRMTDFDPTAQALPASGSVSDTYAARAAKKILQSNHYSYDFQRVYRRHALDIVVQGDGFLKTMYDPYGGRKSV